LDIATFLPAVIQVAEYLSTKLEKRLYWYPWTMCGVDDSVLVISAN
jgi:hypothetical protein